MPRTDADFAAYVAARWPALVRAVVLAGCPRSQAEDVVLTGLARCSTGWERVQRSEDVEVHVHHAVVHAWHQRLHQLHAHGQDPPAAEPPPSDEVADLEPRLAALTQQQRESLVLRAVTGLEPDQVADVLDLDAETVLTQVPGAPGPEAVRAAAATIEVLPAPYDDVADRVRDQRRHRRRIALVSLAVGAVVLGLGAWAGAALSREGARERSADVEQVLNPASLAWYADGVLHLREVTVDIPGIVAVVAVGERVVYVDEDGVVGQVESDGRVHEVGVADRSAAVLGSLDRAWAAWVEPGDPRARLVVWDLAERTEVGGLRVDPPVRPVAIDQGRVSYSSATGSWTWAPPAPAPAALPPVELLDEAAATRVFQRDDQVEIVQPMFGLSFLRSGEGARLSFGGRYVLSRDPGPWEPGEPYRPLLYDTRTGEAIATGVEPDELVVDAAFTPLQEVAYLVVGADADDLLVLRTCDPGAGTCTDVVPVPGDAGALLAGQP